MTVQTSSRPLGSLAKVVPIRVVAVICGPRFLKRGSFMDLEESAKRAQPTMPRTARSTRATLSEWVIELLMERNDSGGRGGGKMCPGETRNAGVLNDVTKGEI